MKTLIALLVLLLSPSFATAATLWINGIQQTAGSVVSLDSTVIGGTTPAAGTFTTLKGKFATVVSAADSKALSALECSDTIITNYGWDGVHDQTFTLPDADTVVGAGLRFILVMGVTEGTRDVYIDPEGNTTKIYLDGTAMTDHHSLWVQEPTIGESVECYTMTLDGTSYDWFCVNRSVASAFGDKGS